MKYSFLIFLCCLPLLGLTGGSFWQLANWSASQRKDDGDAKLAEFKELKDQAELEAKSAKEETKSKAPLAESLAKANLLQPAPLTLPAVAGGPALARPWARLELARKMVGEFVDVGKPLKAYFEARKTGAHDPERASAMLTQLHDFVAKVKAPGDPESSPAGINDLLALLNENETRLGNDSELFIKQQEVQSAETAAGAALNARKWSDCSRELERAEKARDAYLAALKDNPQPGINANDVGAQATSKIELMKKQVAFHQSREKLPTPVAGIPDRNLLAQHQDFLREFSIPPTEQEKNLLLLVREAARAMEVTIALAEIESEQQLEKLLDLAEQIVTAQSTNKAEKDKARAAATTWLKRNIEFEFVIKTEFSNMREVTTGSGNRFVGYFMRAGTQHYFWSDYAKSQTLKNPDTTLSSFANNIGPGELKYKLWADAYKSAAREILKRQRAKKDWERFAFDCETWQKELHAYRREPGVRNKNAMDLDQACDAWDFSAPAEIARDLLSLWPQYERIMKP